MRRRDLILPGLRKSWTAAAVFGTILAGSPAAVLAQGLGGIACRFTTVDGDPRLEVQGPTDFPEGTLITIRIEGRWPDSAGLRPFEGPPDAAVTVTDRRFDDLILIPREVPPGHYLVTLELVPLFQQEPAVAVQFARRRPPPPVRREYFLGTTEDALRRTAEEHALFRKQLDETEVLLDGLGDFARSRQRSDREEGRLKASTDGLYLALKDGAETPRPPFAESRKELHDLLYELLAVVPAPVLDAEGNPAAQDDEGRAIDPQAVFADQRIEKETAAARSRLPKIRNLLNREYANAILAEVERACRMLAEAYRTSAANPRDWAAAVREAREAADKLLAAASAPEAAALGGKGPNHVALLQALTTQLEARPPAPPPADGEAADPKLPADVAEGVENVARSLQAARSKLAS